MLFTKNFAFVCVCVCVSVTVTKAGKVKYAQKLKATWVCEKQKHAKNLVALFDFDFYFCLRNAILHRYYLYLYFCMIMHRFGFDVGSAPKFIHADSK